MTEYEKYQLKWMIDHGYSIRDMITRIGNVAWEELTNDGGLSYDKIIDEAFEIFEEEQGFENEFDEIDTISHHIVVFDEGKPIGTCRFFKENNHYTIGRVAVLKKYRNLHIGNSLLESAENEIKKLHGDLIVVHAQVRIRPFYEKQGYIQFGQIDDDEGVPHVWMKKKIQY